MREQLPAFNYGDNNLNDTDGVRIEKRPIASLDDESLYDGEWNIATNERHGKGK